MPEVKKPALKFKFPKDLGTCIDRLGTLDAEVSKINAAAAAKTGPLEAEYEALEKHLIDSFPKAKLEGAMGAKFSAKIDSQDVPTVKDWEKLRAYIVKTKAWDLLQKRTSSTAFRERWEAKKVIPGVEVFTAIKLKVSARKK